MKSTEQSKMFGLEPEIQIDTGSASVHDKPPKLESKTQLSKNAQFEGKKLLYAKQWSQLKDWVEENSVAIGKFTLRFVALVASKTDKGISCEMEQVFGVCPVPSPGESAVQQVADQLGVTFGTKDRICLLYTSPSPRDS